jgi:hypothetical protein
VLRETSVKGGGGEEGKCERERALERLRYYNPVYPVCVFITAGPSTKMFTWGGGDMGGHVLHPKEALPFLDATIFGLGVSGHP